MLKLLIISYKRDFFFQNIFHFYSYDYRFYYYKQFIMLSKQIVLKISLLFETKINIIIKLKFNVMSNQK